MPDKILVVDDKEMLRDSVTTTLTRAGYRAIAASDGEAALKLIERHRPAAVVTDLKMPGMDGVALLKAIRQRDAHLPVILMTAFATVETAVDAMKTGAFDYIQKPFDGDELVIAVKRAVETHTLRTENEALRSAGSATLDVHPLIGQSPIMQRLRQQIEQVAPSHGTVLITGESGTGKEVVARQVHAQSQRAGRVMLAVNCAALSAGVLESELFGHEKGAFTGAEQLRKGRFELADTGTLLLDEISEVEPATQAKLLRVLQEQQFERVGSSSTQEVDVRVIATTNRDLPRCVTDGRFREDLMYRLNVLPLHVPPLRERREDIPQLAEHFLTSQAQRDGRAAKRFDDAAMNALCDYDWPGNVRELQNICERAGVLATDARIDADLIRPWLDRPRSTSQPQPATTATPNPVGSQAASRDEPGDPVEIAIADRASLEDFERELILRTLKKHNGHRERTAATLGIGVRTLGLKLRKWKEQELVSPDV